MSHRRIQTRELAKLLESASQPLYVLDDSLTIVYLNEACCTWLGTAADELLGRPCVYDSSDSRSGAAATAAGLCPPPAVLEGREVTAAVTYSTGGRTLFRTARFVPLRWADGSVLGTIALVEAIDSAQPPGIAGADGDESQELHLQLQWFRQQNRLRHRALCIVGVTPAARKAAAQAEVAAATRASVLLAGPPGSGRRHLAEAIHYRTGGEPSRPLVPLECGLLDTELIQSTIRSVVALASERGTLLLCDAEQIPAEAQSVLAAALKAGNFPWRTIATAAAPLADLAPRGLFRADLAAMLSTITIDLPPLAKRRDDIPLLAQALLEEQNARGGRQLGGFAPDAVDRLCAYSWPGNVGELAAVVAECHSRAAGTHVARTDLPERLRMAAESSARTRRREEPIQLDEFIARIERELIRRALSRSKGNKARAARLLGLNRPRLYRRMVQLGLIEKDDDGGLTAG